MEHGPTCQAVFNRRDRGIRLAQAGNNTCAEVEGRSNAGAPVNLHDLTCTCMTQADGVEVDIFPTKRRHGVNGVREAPRPRANGGQSSVGQQGGDGETDAGAHHDTVGCTVGLSEEPVVKNDPLRHGMMTLGRTIEVQDADAVLRHGVQNAVVFGERLDIMVHDGQRVLGCIVDQRHRRKATLIANEGRLDAGIDRVTVVEVHKVLLERRQRFTDLECREGSGHIAGDAAVSIGVPSITVGVLKRI